MSDEKLTTEDRATLEEIHEGCVLLRLYDAALARAEAAEEDLDTSQEIACNEGLARKAAESRLAEATALVRNMLDRYEALGLTCFKARSFLSATPAQAWDIRGKEPVLVPVQAAEPVTPEQIRHALARGVRDARIVAGDLVMPAQAAEMEPRRGYCARHAGWKSDCDECALNPPGHPDAVALRECRVELERTQSVLGNRIADMQHEACVGRRALESARAERDTWNRMAETVQRELTVRTAERDTAREQTETTCKLLGECARELDTAHQETAMHFEAHQQAQARIAELEVENAEFRRLFSAPRKPDVKLVATLETLETYALELKSERARIARAVAELEKATAATDAGMVDPYAVCVRALEALQ